MYSFPFIIIYNIFTVVILEVRLLDVRIISGHFKIMLKPLKYDKYLFCN